MCVSSIQGCISTFKVFCRQRATSIPRHLRSETSAAAGAFFRPQSTPESASRKSNTDMRHPIEFYNPIIKTVSIQYTGWREKAREREFASPSLGEPPEDELRARLLAEGIGCLLFRFLIFCARRPKAPSTPSRRIRRTEGFLLLDNLAPTRRGTDFIGTRCSAAGAMISRRRIVAFSWRRSRRLLNATTATRPDSSEVLNTSRCRVE